MSFPYLLCVAAVAAATAAATAGYLLNPARRRRRHRVVQRSAVQCMVAGRLTRPGEWIAFWYEHELDDLGHLDDSARGGA